MAASIRGTVMKQSIRIIGGCYRGKKLAFPDNEGLRPTPNRVRETLFNWLMHDIKGAHCLDAFAGSGALGFEAYSRGAANVVLLEHDKSAYRYLLKNAQSFQAPPEVLQIRQQDTLLYLQTAQRSFDIIFLDPPFAKDMLAPCIELLQNNTLLQNHGLLYFESSQPILLPENKWQPVRAKRAGQVIYGLYKKVSR